LKNKNAKLEVQRKESEALKAKIKKLGAKN